MILVKVFLQSILVSGNPLPPNSNCYFVFSLMGREGCLWTMEGDSIELSLLIDREHPELGVSSASEVILGDFDWLDPEP